MRRSLFPILLLLITSALSKLSVPIPKPGDEDVALNSRQLNINIYPPSDPTGLFHFLSDVITKKTPESNVELKPSNPSQTGVQLLQTSLNDLKADNSQKQNGFSAIAVRFGKLQQPIAWDGVLGQDWGHTLITVDGSEGQSLWDYYWVRSGHITVTSSTLANDVVVGGAYYTSRDPQNPNASTITIVRTP